MVYIDTNSTDVYYNFGCEYYFATEKIFEDTVSLCKKYDLFPSLKEWENKILLLETSENKPEPKLYRKMIGTLKDYGIFDVLSGVLVGLPVKTYPLFII